MARSIQQLGIEAANLVDPGSAINPGALIHYIERGYREFVHEAGGVYRNIAEITLVSGQREYDLPSDWREVLVDGVTITRDDGVLYMPEYRSIEYVDITNTETGNPLYYSYSDPLTLALDPIPDGIYPTLTLRYDAEAPDALLEGDSLPIPAYLEGGLIGYALARSGLNPAGMEDFENAISTWRAAIFRRMEATSRRGKW